MDCDINNMKWVEKEGKNNFPLWIGLSLLVIAFSIWLYSILEIQSNEIMLDQYLSVEEVWMYEGALSWWRNFYGAVILPIIGILSITGAVMISGPRLWHFIHKLILK